MSKQGHSQEQIDRKLKSIESWQDTIIKYKKEIQQINDRIIPNKSHEDLDRFERDKSIIHNNIQIAEHNVRKLESELMIDKLRKQNYRIKTKYDLLV